MKGEEKLQFAFEQVAPGVHALTPGMRDAFRTFMSRVIQVYQESDKKEQAAIWNVHRKDLDFPPEDFASK